MIYNSLILPHMNYSFLAWGSNCHSIELLQKKAVRVVNEEACASGDTYRAYTKKV